MFEVQKETLLDRTTVQLWEILLDFDRYERWNPYVRPQGTAELARPCAAMRAKGMKAAPEIFAGHHARNLAAARAIPAMTLDFETPADKIQAVLVSAGDLLP